MTDEDEFKKIKQQLERKEKVEKLLIDTSIQFSKYGDFDEAMNLYLKKLLELTNVDRVFVTYIENNLINVSYEVVKPGIIPRKPFMQNIPYQEMPWFKKMHLKQGYVAIHSLEDFPEEAKAEKELYKFTGTQASLIKSFSSQKVMKGFFTLEQSVPRAVWEPEYIQLVSFGAVLIEHTQERMTAENSLLAAKEKAEESDRLKSAFIANLSHEIRTPLNAIVGFSELLIHSRNDEKKKQKYFRIIDHNSRQLTSVISDILDIAKIESGSMELHETPLMLYPFMQDQFVQFYESNLKSPETKLILSFPEDEQLAIMADQTRLKQVIDNLVKNAFKFTERGFVEFGCYIENNSLIFFVKDSGIGIKHENFGLIFERFKQVEFSGTRTYGGNGLGLSICKQLVKLMSGDIWLESEFGKGTNFFFSIPLKKASYTAIINFKTSLQESYTEFEHKHFLVIDDTNDSRLYLQIIIENAGASCHPVGNITEFEAILPQLKNIDVVLLDIQMPGVSGDFLLQQIKSYNTQLPVIAVTAYAMIGDKEYYLNKGFDAYISKPVNKSELFETIVQFLRTKKVN